MSEGVTERQLLEDTLAARSGLGLYDNGNCLTGTAMTGYGDDAPGLNGCLPGQWRSSLGHRESERTTQAATARHQRQAVPLSFEPISEEVPLSRTQPQTLRTDESAQARTLANLSIQATRVMLALKTHLEAHGASRHWVETIEQATTLTGLPPAFRDALIEEQGNNKDAILAFVQQQLTAAAAVAPSPPHHCSAWLAPIVACTHARESHRFSQ